MVIAALTYISVSALLILGAFVFFMKALQSLSQPDRKPSYSASRRDRASLHASNLIAAELEQSVLTAKRAEIIEMLERQFHSSP
jgi:hypothetical protein